MTSHESRVNVDKHKKSIIGSFLGRIHRSRSRSSDRKANGHRAEPIYEVPASKSHDELTLRSRASRDASATRDGEAPAPTPATKPSPARRLINRLSFRNRSRDRVRAETEKADLHVVELDSPPTARHVAFVSEHDLRQAGARKFVETSFADSPRGAAVSDLDLRFVTSRREFDEFSTPENSFAEPRAFLSENDLTAPADFEMPQQKTPSYLRLSRALNGYVRSPARAAEVSEAAKAMGESLVERRLRLFGQPQPNNYGFSSPLVSSASNTNSCRSPVAPSTPVGCLKDANLNMGNNSSTPGPIREMISRFEKLEICNFDKSRDEKDGENIPPHSIIVNQPGFDEKPTARIDGESSDSEAIPETENPPPSRISIDTAESDSGISGSCTNSPESTKRGVDEQTHKDEEIQGAGLANDDYAKDGAEFEKMTEFILRDLHEKIAAAQNDLETVKDLPDASGDALRSAAGGATMLLKRIRLFESLIHDHMFPTAERKPVLMDDLRSFYETISTQLTKINSAFDTVATLRSSNWKIVPEDEPVRPPPQPSKLPTAKKTPPALSTEAAAKVQKQRAEADERRSKARQEMRARAKQLKESTVDESQA